MFSTFAKVIVCRESYHNYKAQVLASVYYCLHGSQDPVELSSCVWFSIGDIVTSRIPGLYSLPIGKSMIRKLRLRTLGYDRRDRAFIV